MSKASKRARPTDRRSRKGSTPDQIERRRLRAALAVKRDVKRLARQLETADQTAHDAIGQMLNVYCRTNGFTLLRAEQVAAMDAKHRDQDAEYQRLRTRVAELEQGLELTRS